MPRFLVTLSIEAIDYGDALSAALGIADYAEAFIADVSKEEEDGCD